MYYITDVVMVLSKAYIKHISNVAGLDVVIIITYAKTVQFIKADLLNT